MKTKLTTSDIYFVAALLTTGAKIDSVDKTDIRHIKFTVVQTDLTYNWQSENLPSGGGNLTASLNGMEFYENLWANGTFMVNAVNYKNAIQQVKTLIHST